MPVPLRTPRINNNDDTVRLSQIVARPGASVRAGEQVAEIETDKATFTVEAEQDGYVLSVHGKEGDILEVGSILMWMGSSPDEPVPAENIAPRGELSSAPAVTSSLKASLLLQRYGLDASTVPAAGSRLSAADVEAYAAKNGLQPTARATTAPAAAAQVSLPPVPGTLGRLSPEDRGMLRTVLWHRDEAVAGHVEIQYDPRPWADYADAFQKSENLLLSPLLALVAWQLVQVAKEDPRLNSTIAGDRRYVYGQVNLGFTVQSRSTLYLAVVEAAERLPAREFIDRLSELQRKAMKDSLKPQESSGSTIAFTSMARWKVSRHAPILPPHNSLIVAHTAAVSPSSAFLGATYDHRAMSGGDVVRALQKISAPPEL
jgi:pyruvate/2-oxoglutarate dehydrogenase complex dihydrolipoamide acyltransferase (E2) component